MKIGIEASFLTQKNAAELLKLFEDIYIDFDNENGYGRKNKDIWLLSYDFSCKDKNHGFGYELASSVGDLKFFEHSIEYFNDKFEKGKFETNEKCEFHINISSDNNFKKIFENDLNKLYFSSNIERLFEENKIFFDKKRSVHELICKSFVHWKYFSKESEIIELAYCKEKDFFSKILRIINNFKISPFSNIPLWKSKFSLVNYEKLRENIIELKIRDKNYHQNLDKIKNIVKTNVPELLKQTGKKYSKKRIHMEILEDLKKATETKLVYDSEKSPYEFLYMK